MMTDEMERIWKEAVVVYSRQYTNRITSVTAGIQIEHLPNISLECYRYANPLAE
jgi:hypothetical protein